MSRILLCGRVDGDFSGLCVCVYMCICMPVWFVCACLAVLLWLFISLGVLEICVLKCIYKPVLFGYSQSTKAQAKFNIMIYSMKIPLLRHALSPLSGFQSFLEVGDLGGLVAPCNKGPRLPFLHIPLLTTSRPRATA